MIFVDRSVVPVPGVLTSTRAQAERERIAALFHSSKEHLDQLRITFDESIWKEARADLVALFHDKCAFCESRIGTGFSGDVHHFRPKDGARNLEGTKRDHLHYAWLAYEWENLLLTCANCVLPHTEGERVLGKGDVFPVVGERAAVLATVAECRTVERWLLLDPTVDDPRWDLTFDQDGNCLSMTGRGRVTIDLLDLNRDSLVQPRKHAWAWTVDAVRRWVDVVAAKNNPVKRHRIANDMLTAAGEYAGTRRVAAKWTIEGIRSGRFAVAGKVRSLDALYAKLLEASTGDLRQAVESARSPRVKELEAFAVEPASPVVPRVVRHAGREKLPPFAHQRLRRIEIRNFKVIETLDFDLADPPDAEGSAGVLMLLGENASGKSTVLEAVALALLGTTEIAKLGLRAENFIRRTDWNASLSNAKPAEVRIFFEGTPEPVTLTIDPKTKKFSGNAKPATVLLGYGPRRFFSDERGLRRSPRPHARVETLFDPLAVITNPNGWLLRSHDSLFNPTIRALRQILVLPDEAVVERPPAGKRKGAEMLFEIQGIRAPLKRLSEGYKTVVATGVDIMREMLRYWPELESARGVVLIDEIETHLHPRWKMRLVQRLRKAMPQVQFIATTHDPLCLRGLFNGEVAVLVRDEVHNVERLAALPNVRGLSVEQLLTSDLFGLFTTEDPAVEEELARYIALAAKRDRTEDEERELARHRERTQERMILGNTPGTQVVYQAVNEYLHERRAKPHAQRAALKRESVTKVVDLWKSIGTDGAAE